jgi:hypothetical protein
MKTKPLLAWLTLMTIMLAGTFLRVYDIQIPAEASDDGPYLYQGMEVYQGFKPYTGFFMAHPPLNAYLSALGYSLFGLGVLQGRAFNVLFSIATLPLIFVVARRFYGLYPALLSVLLFSLCPGVILFTKYSYLASSTLFFSLLSAYMFLVGLERESIRTSLICGAFAGLAMLGKFTAAPLLAAFVAFALVRKVKPAVMLAVMAGFLCVFVPVSLVFLSGQFIDQVFLFHLSKVGFDIVSRLKLAPLVIFSKFPSILVFGLTGLYLSLMRGRLSDPDLFWALNAGFGLLLAVSVTTNSIIVPALYFATSAYALALLATRVVGADRVILIFLVLLFVSATTLATLKMVSCEHLGNLRLDEETTAAADYVRGRSSSGELAVVYGSSGYYVPLRSGVRVVPELSDLSGFRFLLDLDSASLERLSSRARFIVIYEENGSFNDEYVFSLLSVRNNPRMARIDEQIHDVLTRNAHLARRFGRLSIYEREPAFANDA